MKTAIIIGSGIAGIATAIRLQHKGYQCIVLESQESLGGKIQELKQDGFRWDKGPSLFTLPELFDELYLLCGKNPRDYYRFQRQDRICNYFWNDGARFQASANPETFVQEASIVFGEPIKNLRSFLENAKLKYTLASPLFLEQSLHLLKSFWKKNALRACLRIFKLDLFKNMDQVHRRYFKNEKLIQIFNRYATYNGSSPYRAPGILSLIPHLEMDRGTFFPEGGIRQLIEGLIQLAKEQGVQFNSREPVLEICMKNKQAIGVQSTKKYYPADVVVSNADVYMTYTKLIPKIKIPNPVIQQEKSSSGIIFYWGMNREFPELDLHNLFFSENYRAEFEQCFGNKGFSDDPSTYIHISSKNNKKDAPAGGENWFVMINTANNSGQNWDHLVLEARRVILKKLSLLLNCNLENHIISESHLDPRGIEQKTGSHKGALYGPSSNSKYAAFLRHPNFKSRLSNVYFCGGSVHPGGGMPLCLNSAKITSQLIPQP